MVTNEHKQNLVLEYFICSFTIIWTVYWINLPDMSLDIYDNAEYIILLGIPKGIILLPSLLETLTLLDFLNYYANL